MGSTIDPTTGLPLVDSGIVEQISLGGQVFPFDDLDAVDRPARLPLYGDDVFPTTALMVGRHPTLVQPQAIYTDTAHSLSTRESVYQSAGVPIPPGTTAPVDVNVVGGGGGSTPSIVARQIPQATPFGGVVTTPQGTWTERYLYGYIMSMYTGDIPNTNTADFCGGAIIPQRPGTTPVLTLFAQWMTRNTTTQGRFGISENKMYPTRLDLQGILGSGPYLYVNMGEGNNPSTTMFVMVLVGN